MLEKAAKKNHPSGIAGQDGVNTAGKQGTRETSEHGEEHDKDPPSKKTKAENSVKANKTLEETDIGATDSKSSAKKPAASKHKEESEKAPPSQKRKGTNACRNFSRVLGAHGGSYKLTRNPHRESAPPRSSERRIPILFIAGASYESVRGTSVPILVLDTVHEGEESHERKRSVSCTANRQPRRSGHQKSCQLENAHRDELSESLSSSRKQSD
jgi:hypothetical protein